MPQSDECDVAASCADCIIPRWQLFLRCTPSSQADWASKVALICAAEPAANFLCDFLWRVANTALPSDRYPPPSSQERVDVALVAGNVRFELGRPELRPGSWSRCKETVFMAMPETTVNEDCCLPARQHDIRRSRQRLSMKSEPEAGTVQAAPKQHLGFRVLPTNSRHHPGACLLIDNISHSGAWLILLAALERHGEHGW